MKRRFTILAAAFTLLAFLAIPMGMRGQTRAEVVAYTLEPVAGSNNSYAGNCDITIDGITWNLTGNSQQIPWRIGGKNLTGVDRTLYSKTPIQDNVTKIEVTHGNVTLTAVNSWTVIVASDASFNTIVSTLTPTFTANATTTINRPNGADWSNCYYKFVYNVSAGSSNQYLQFSGAEFYKQEGSGPVIATPTFDPAGGSYITTQNVTISCETQGSTIYYTTDGSTPDNTSTQYDGAITVSETTTINAIAYVDNDASSVATATYTIVQPLTTMQAVFDKATEVGNTATYVYITLGNWVVSGVSTNGKNVFVTDGTKGFVIYDGGGNTGFAAGNILNGTVYCKVQLYNGFAELTLLNTTTSGISVTTGGTVTAANIAMAELAGVNTGALVHYDNLTCSVDNNKYYLSDGTTTIQVYNSLYAFGSTLVADHVYNITGVYQQFTTTTADTKEILPRSADDIEEVTTGSPIIDAENVSIACNATSGAIEYSISNEPNPAGVLTAATAAEWLTIGTIGETVPFTCTANSETTARTATVTLTYTYNRATVTKDVTVTQAAYEAPHYTWDLSIDQTATATTTEMTWTSNYATMAVIKAGATTNTNNYYPGTSGHTYTSTRFYKDSELTLSPVSGYAITSVVFQATSHNYATALCGSTWTNATATMEEGDNVTVVTIIPTDGTIDMLAVIGATCGFTGVTVYYVENNNPSIIANNVEIAYDATSGTIAYTINNEVTGGVLTAATTDEWLTLGTVGTTVPFTCAANATASPRTATVTLTYTYNTDQFVIKNITVTQAGNPNTIDNISDITAAGTYTVQGTIVAISNRGFILGDGTGYVYYYNNSNEYDPGDYNIGDMVKLAGSVVVYGGVYEFDSSTEITYVEESNYVEEDPTVLSGADMDARVSSTSPAQLSSYVQYEGLLAISGSGDNIHYNVTNIAGAQTAIGSISFPYDTEFASLEGKQVIVRGYYVGISTGTYYNTMLGSVEEVEVQHEQYTLTVGNLLNVNTFVFDAADQNEALLEGEGSVLIYDGTQVLVSVDVEEGYALQSLIVDGVNVISQIDATGAYTFFMPTHNVSITATAEEIIVPTDGDYVRISSLDQLTDGSIVVIASRYDSIANNYFAMKNTISNGKAQGEAFVSTTSNGNEILPADIVDNEDDYYWVVNVTAGVYTFTNANGDVISYNSSTNFNMNGNNTTWSIVRDTSGAALVPSYEGFVITNVNTNNRCIAFRGDTEVFGAYSTSNLTADQYNFFLDFFVQTEAPQTLTQTITLAQGSNWFSTNLEITLADLQTALHAALPSAANRSIKITSQNSGYSQNLGNNWNGQLRTLDVAQMYMITVPAACEITLEGMPIDPAEHPVNIVVGSNWIGFPLQEEMTPNNALAGFGTAGDVVKSQNSGQATKRGNAWMGQLRNLVPGQGYIYNASATGTLTFPVSAK